ncbi:hypothetical protein Q8W15_11650 [Photobacterium damselae subsp. piscicida]|nr:hypothetical protein [Photobacterium damselae subsp. piscicida]
MLSPPVAEDVTWAGADVIALGCSVFTLVAEDCSAIGSPASTAIGPNTVAVATVASAALVAVLADGETLLAGTVGFAGIVK